MTTTKTGTKPKTKKVAKSVKKTLEKTNKKVVTQKVIINRTLKYKYPKGCNDTLLRKAFRQRVRDKINKMELQITKLRGEGRRVLKAELEAYRTEFKT